MAVKNNPVPPVPGDAERNKNLEIAIAQIEKEFLDNAVPAIKQALAAAAEARKSGKRIVQADNVKMKINAI